MPPVSPISITPASVVITQWCPPHGDVPRAKRQSDGTPPGTAASTFDIRWSSRSLRPSGPGRSLLFGDLYLDLFFDLDVLVLDGRFAFGSFIAVLGVVLLPGSLTFGGGVAPM